MLLIKSVFILYLSLVATVVHADADLPNFFEATYNLYRSGSKIARMSRQFGPGEKNQFIFRSESRTTGFIALFRKDHIIEESQWEMNEKGLRPVYYTYQHTGGKKDRFVDINFDWNLQKITNKVGESVWYMPTQNGILDKLLYQLAIMHDLNRGVIPETYTIADGGKIKTYLFEYHGKETINIPAGQFDTIKLERHKSNSKRKTFLWCAEKLGHLPVKVMHVEKDGSKTIAKLVEVNGL